MILNGKIGRNKQTKQKKDKKDPRNTIFVFLRLELSSISNKLHLFFDPDIRKSFIDGLIVVLGSLLSEALLKKQNAVFPHLKSWVCYSNFIIYSERVCQQLRHLPPACPMRKLIPSVEVSCKSRLKTVQVLDPFSTTTLYKTMDGWHPNSPTSFQQSKELLLWVPLPQLPACLGNRLHPSGLTDGASATANLSAPL